MIIQEPVQAAIWHCLNHYDYSDAVFLSERLYAEVKSDETLFLLATAYFRSNQIDHAYHILKEKHGCSPQCRYLFAKCAYELQKYFEAQTVLLENIACSNNNFDEVIVEYGDQAAFVLLLLAKIAIKTEHKQKAVEALKRALKLNPFLWSAFETLCRIGEKPDPNAVFQLGELDNLSKCHGSSLNNIESMLVNQTPSQDNSTQYIMTPPQLIFTPDPPANNFINKALFSPDQSNLPSNVMLSGVMPLNNLKLHKSLIHRMSDCSADAHSFSPSFGTLIDREDVNTPALPYPTLTESNELKSFTKKVRNLINRKEPVLQNSKPVFSLSSNVANTISITPGAPTPMGAGQNVRRSSRLFSSSYSVKENNKSPNRNKFPPPKSPSRKTKQRLAKCSLNDFNAYNSLKKEKSATVTSNNDNKHSNSNGNVTATQIQKQSAEGLMYLLRSIGQGYVYLRQFNCKAAIGEFQNLPSHQYNTSWVYTMMGLAYFEMADYENCVKFFNDIHTREPYRISYMDVYSTALWHLQREVALSGLAQDLIQLNKNSPVTWIVSGNCFSLHKEHDTAIKFLHRAVQVDPNFPYAYTLLGHEYIMTEELDKALSCYRSAIRLDARHYNAWFGIGTIYSKQERFHLAEHHYNMALSINTYSSVILCHIGVVQHAQKKSELALQSLNMAIKNDPKNPLCKFHRGSIYFALGRLNEALRELEELKEIVPKESLVYYLIGKIHRKRLNNDLALMYFSWATDLDPKGASSQIKEAFDPSIGRGGDMDSPLSPVDGQEDSPTESNSGQQREPIVAMAGYNYDSDSDSL